MINGRTGVVPSSDRPATSPCRLVNSFANSQAMKTVTRHILLLVALLADSCEQDFVVYNNDPCDGSDPSIICPPAPVDDCPDDATAGSIDLTKFVAIGNSMGAGYQAGALFSAGPEDRN